MLGDKRDRINHVLNDVVRVDQVEPGTVGRKLLEPAGNDIQPGGAAGSTILFGWFKAFDDGIRE